MTTQSPASNPLLRHALILCHPDPASFNRAIAETYCETVRNLGHDVLVRDLYAIGFDPVLKANERPTLEGFRISQDVEEEIARLTGCDVLRFSRDSSQRCLMFSGLSFLPLKTACSAKLRRSSGTLR